MFDPLRAIGVYELKCSAASSDSGAASQLIIHGFTDGETGLFASLQIGDALTGVAVVAGSRKGVKEIVDDLEDEGGSEEEEAEEDVDGEAAEAAGNEGDAPDQDEGDQGDEEEEEDDSGDAGPRSAMEEEDDRINRRAKAFEKNSFRNPKFWMRWTADVKVSKDAEPTHEQDMGYLVFSGNDCATFEGTISSDKLEWKNLKIKGRKIKSNAPGCNQKWGDFSGKRSHEQHHDQRILQPIPSEGQDVDSNIDSFFSRIRSTN